MKRILAITVILLTSACEEPIPKCVPGATVECPCPGRAPGYQVCAPVGVFSSCQCSSHEAQPADAGLGGFWCSTVGCWPDKALCGLAAARYERINIMNVVVKPCEWRREAYCYPHAWGLKCFEEEEQCENFRTDRAFRDAKSAAEFFRMTPKERAPMGPCRVLEYAW
jgi:hypothetical protein